MEGRKPSGSSHSISTELFGSKDSSSSSSSGIFGSIFSPSSKALGRETPPSESLERKEEYSWSTKPGVPGDDSKTTETESQGLPNRDMSSIYQEQRVQPCHLSSSIYYGGQDICSQPQNPQGSGINSMFKKDGEDDSGSASRGNWWQGSLYY